MIHHVSISAREPKHVADVLAEVMDGRCYPFLGPIPNSWMAVSGDAVGTIIEVYPADVTLQPGTQDNEQVAAIRQQPRLPTVPFHFMLSVCTDLGTIERIGKREGWRTKLYGRGVPGQKPMFHVVEFWIENTIMLELAPYEMMDAYIDLMQIPTLEKMFDRKQAA